MNWVQGDFLGFHPQYDSDAALKFAIECLLSDDRLDSIARLITDGHEVGGLEGEPGWFIERRDSARVAGSPHYGRWPVWASFRAYVDPDSYHLAHPEVFVTTSELYDCLRKGLRGCIEKGLGSTKVARELLVRISS